MIVWSVARKFSPQEWQDFIEKCDKLIRHSPVYLTGNTFRHPQLTDEFVELNGTSSHPDTLTRNKRGVYCGINDAGCGGAFIFRRDGEAFDECETHNKPYDLIVRACLIVAQCTFGNKICVMIMPEDVQSWENAIKYVASFFPELAISFSLNYLHRKKIRMPSLDE